VEQTVDVVIPVPKAYALFNNYPNPFNPTTNIKFQLPEVSEVNINVYDMSGKLVKSLVRNQSYNAGEFTVQWDATDATSNRVASGMYVYHFQAGSFSKVGKMVLLK
jgi:flagellar hook assembly protein FlgD